MPNSGRTESKRRNSHESIAPYWLHIGKGDRVKVPKKYHPVINASAVVYDQIRTCLTEKVFRDLRSWRYEFRPGEQANYEESGLHMLDWLKSVGNRSAVEEILVKRVSTSLVGDLLDFVFESMNSMKYGRASVSFSLLRKPFVDHLRLLEEILVDSGDFVDRFYHDGALASYDPSSRKSSAKPLVQKACSILKMNLVYDSDLIYRLRYDKAVGVSVDSYSNRALHIVTTDKNYRTSDGEFNFIFSGDEDHLNYFEDYYQYSTLLLFYTAEIIDTIWERYVYAPELMSLRRFQRLLAMDRWSKLYTKSGARTHRSLFQILSTALRVTCETCKKDNRMEQVDTLFVLEHDYWICTGCKGNLLDQKTTIDLIDKLLPAFQRAS